MLQDQKQQNKQQESNQSKEQSIDLKLLPKSDFQFIPLENNQIKLSIGKEAIIIKCDAKLLDSLANTINKIAPNSLNELLKNKDFHKFFNKHNLQASEIEFKIGKEVITFKCNQKLLRNLEETINKITPTDLESLFKNNLFKNFSQKYNLQVSNIENSSFHGTFSTLGHVTFSSDIKFTNCTFNHDTHLILPLVKNVSFKNCFFGKNASININDPKAKMEINGCRFLPCKDIKHPIQGRMEGLRIYGNLHSINISNSEGSINITENNCTLKHRLYIDTQTTKITGGEITTKYLREDYIGGKINEAHIRDNKILEKMQNTLNTLEQKYLLKTKELQTTSRWRLLKRDNLKDEIGVLEYQIITLKNKMLPYEAYGKLNDLSSTINFKEVTSIKNNGDKISYSYDGNNHSVSLRNRFLVPKEEKILRQPIIHRDSCSMIDSLMTSIDKLSMKLSRKNNNFKPLYNSMAKIFSELYKKKDDILASGKQYRKELIKYFGEFKQHYPSLYNIYKNEIETFLNDCKKYSPAKKQGK